MGFGAPYIRDFTVIDYDIVYVCMPCVFTYIDGLVQERRISIANALELRLLLR